MIADRLKIVMGGMSKREFAKKLEISPSTVWEYLQGRTPPADFIARVCDRFGVSEKWLLSGKGEMSATGCCESSQVNPDLMRALNSHPSIEKIVLMLEGMDDETIQNFFGEVNEKKKFREMEEKLKRLEDQLG